MSQSDTISLLDKYLNGNCSSEELQKVETWLDDMNQGNSEWMDMTEEPRIAYINALFKSLQQEIEEKEVEAFKKNKSIKHQFLYWAAAAVLFLAATYGVLYVTLFKTEVSTTVQQFVSSKTGIGEMKMVVLKDGTQVWLNAVSELRYPSHFSKDKREVFVNGEAFFKVAKDENKPFIVHSGVLNTKVLGTSFNVSAYTEDDNIKVTVVSGKVAIDKADSKVEKPIDLIRNEQITYNKKDSALKKNDVEELSNCLAWKDEKLVFYHTPMKKVVRTLQRVFGLNIRLEDKALTDCDISGQFDKKQDPEGILKAICMSIGAKYLIRGDEVKITGINNK